MTNDTVTLAPAHPDDLPAFKRELQEAFAIAVVAEFGALPDGPIPSDDDLDATFAHPGAVVLRIRHEGRAVGGAVVTIDGETHRNTLDLFFVSPARMDAAWGAGPGSRSSGCFRRRGSGRRTPVFREAEHPLLRQRLRLPDRRVLQRPSPGPARPGQDDLPGDGEAFRFEKVM